MVTRLKNLAKKSKTLVIANNIYANWRTKTQLESGNAESFWGATHSNFSLAESLAYIETVYRDYLTYAAVPEEIFAGRKMLELGPGDNFGVALKFLASGATQVVCIDKFYSERNTQQQHKIYLALREGLSETARKRFDEAINLEQGIEINPDKLIYIYGTGIEEAEEKLSPHAPFDMIVSRGVLQSVHETDRAFDVMDKLIVPGGLMWHKMDLRDLGIFINYEMHPLTALTIPASVYRAMSANTGNSNRKLIGYYRQQMKRLNYDSKIFITLLTGQKSEMHPHKEKIEPGVDYTEETVALVNKIRPKLSPEFRDLSDEELMVAGIFLFATKPGA